MTLIGYLAGSVLFGLVEAKRAGVDLRATGSGNVGATNVGRALGRGVGRKVLLLDALKGLLPSLAALLLLGRDDPWTAATGLATAVGHAYPIFFRFRGGKAAATGVGALLGIVWPAGLAAALVYVVGKKLTRRASVGSLAGALVALGVTAAWLRDTPPTWMAAGLTALIVWRHRGNIARLARGEEPPG
ncbi:MAG: glycerol-3-phosphate 1-O-acyltransferase PlsY [Myxococcales bacterium]|nr:glycerol-3-phosphate 1-O-acyltransferase PlsY [Myxococcales bacterium]